MEAMPKIDVASICAGVMLEVLCLKGSLRTLEHLEFQETSEIKSLVI